MIDKPTTDGKNNGNQIDNIASSIKKYEDIYDFYTAEASKIARQLAFSIGAIIWLLYLSTNHGYKLLVSTTYILLILFFISDLAQYLYGSIKFFWLIDFISGVREQNQETDLKFEYPQHFIKPLTTLNLIKFIFLGMSSICLMIMFSIFLIYPC